MRRVLALCVAALAATTATSAQGVLDPIAWTLAAQPAGATSTPGGTLTLALTATIDEGWHLYATKLEPGGPVATSITIPEGQAFALAGDIGEPLPTSSFDGNFNKVLEYHETRAVFTLPVKFAAAAQPGKQTVRVTANYQTCNDRLCLPARQVTTTADVQIVAKTPPAPLK